MFEMVLNTSLVTVSSSHYYLTVFDILPRKFKVVREWQHQKVTQTVITCSKLIIETVEQGVKLFGQKLQHFSNDALHSYYKIYYKVCYKEMK